MHYSVVDIEIKYIVNKFDILAIETEYAITSEYAEVSVYCQVTYKILRHTECKRVQEH